MPTRRPTVQPVGIDLGTTYSSLARLNPQGQPETIPNDEGELSTPSVVLFEGDVIVVGTFKERAGFHGCKMPEQLLGRIIRCCSEAGALVVDPFSGSATTLAVAKKLRRRFLGFDVSEEYVQRGLGRLAGVAPGDPLNGSANPLLSAPKTSETMEGSQSSPSRARRPGQGKQGSRAGQALPDA